MASSPDNDGTGQHRQMARVRQARRRGVRRRNQWWNPLKWTAGSNLVDLGRSASSVVVGCEDGRVLDLVVGWPGAEVTVKACGVAVTRLAGEKLGADPVEWSMVNVGTSVESPSRLVGQTGRGKARRLLMARRWGGALVVVRGRESRSHGEGEQRDRSQSAGTSGGRR